MNVCGKLIVRNTVQLAIAKKRLDAMSAIARELSIFVDFDLDASVTEL